MVPGEQLAKGGRGASLSTHEFEKQEEKQTLGLGLVAGPTLNLCEAMALSPSTKNKPREESKRRVTLTSVSSCRPHAMRG